MKAYKTVEQLCEDIDEQTKDIWQHQDDVETLSVAVLKLSALNMGLGQHYTKARSDGSAAKTAYQYQRDMKKLSYVYDGQSASVAESQAKIDCKDLLDEWNTAKQMVVLISTKRSDTSQIINDAKARINIIKNDQRS